MFLGDSFCYLVDLVYCTTVIGKRGLAGHRGNVYVKCGKDGKKRKKRIASIQADLEEVKERVSELETEKMQREN